MDQLFPPAARGRKVFVGVVHLLPLPGSPGWQGSLPSVLERAHREAQVLADGGADGIIVENFGDSPFRIGLVEPVTVAAMTLAVERVRQATDLPVGVNVLRNDAGSALGIAAATGCQFIRVNIHYGTMAADEGIVTGDAYGTLRQRQALAPRVHILADVLVKHAAPLGNPDLGLMARETAYRGKADGLIVTGPVTGWPAKGNDVAEARKAVPDRLLLVGSGVAEANARELLQYSDGAIVGTSLKTGGVVTNPLDPARVKGMARVIHAL